MLKRVALIVLFVMTSTSVLAQYDHPRKERKAAATGSRDGRWETSVVVPYQKGIQKDFEGGSALDIDSGAGWGIGVGWNWTDKLSLSYKLLSLSPKYSAIVVPEDPELAPILQENKLSKLTHQFNATYHFFRGSFTPFVTAGLGWTKLDSNIPAGPLEGGCWWDPWWGYSCTVGWRTYNTSKLSYNLGLGIRWDISDIFFSRAAYSREFISVDAGSVDFDMALLEVGLAF